MKIETAIIRKTSSGARLVPPLVPNRDGNKLPVAFCIRGQYFKAKKAENLYNRVGRDPEPILPKQPRMRIMQDDFAVDSNIPCYIIDRGCDIEIIVE